MPRPTLYAPMVRSQEKDSGDLGTGWRALFTRWFENVDPSELVGVIVAYGSDEEVPWSWRPRLSVHHIVQDDERRGGVVNIAWCGLCLTVRYATIVERDDSARIAQLVEEYDASFPALAEARRALQARAMPAERASRIYIGDNPQLRMIAAQHGKAPGADGYVTYTREEWRTLVLAPRKKS